MNLIWACDIQGDLASTYLMFQEIWSVKLRWFCISFQIQSNLNLVQLIERNDGPCQLRDSAFLT